MYTYTPSPFPYVTAQQVHASQLRLFISLLINSSRGRSVGRVAWGPCQDEGHHQFLWPKRANRREIVQRFSHSFTESSKVNGIHAHILRHISRHSTNIGSERRIIGRREIGLEWSSPRRFGNRLNGIIKRRS